MKRTFKDEELKPIMVSLLETLIGFEIGLFDMLCMYQLEDGRFAVYNQTDTYKPLAEGDEYLFEKAPDAVDLFLKFRHDRQLGFDHECGWVKQLEEDLRPDACCEDCDDIYPALLQILSIFIFRSLLDWGC